MILFSGTAGWETVDWDSEIEWFATLSRLRRNVMDRVLCRATVLLCVLCCLGFADSIPTITAVVQPNGLETNYSYTLANGAAATDDIFSFELSFGQNVPIDSVLPAPAGWNVSADLQTSSITWLSSGNAYDIEPGTSLSNFGFLSSFEPAAVGAVVLDWDPVRNGPAPGPGGVHNLSTTGPAISNVPEPGSMFLLLAGLPLAILLRRFRRGAQAHHPRNLEV